MICQAFGCTPSEALRQDPRLVHAILEYRHAHAAMAQQAAGHALNRYQDALLLRMADAQEG